jgi:hypothetical protein
LIASDDPAILGLWAVRGERAGLAATTARCDAAALGDAARGARCT